MSTHGNLVCAGGGGGGGGGFLDDDRKTVARVSNAVEEERPRVRAPPKGKGMQLGSKTKQSQDVLRAMQAEDELMGMVEAPAAAPGPASKPKRPAGGGGGGEGVTLRAEERLVVRMSKDGNIDASEVKGELKMLINDAEASYTRVQVSLAHGWMVVLFWDV